MRGEARSTEMLASKLLFELRLLLCTWVQVLCKSACLEAVSVRLLLVASAFVWHGPLLDDYDDEGGSCHAADLLSWTRVFCCGSRLTKAAHLRTPRRKAQVVSSAAHEKVPKRPFSDNAQQATVWNRRFNSSKEGGINSVIRILRIS